QRRQRRATRREHGWPASPGECPRRSASGDENVPPGLGPAAAFCRPSRLERQGSWRKGRRPWAVAPWRRRGPHASIGMLRGPPQEGSAAGSGVVCRVAGERRGGEAARPGAGARRRRRPPAAAWGVRGPPPPPPPPPRTPAATPPPLFPPPIGRPHGLDLPCAK